MFYWHGSFVCVYSLLKQLQVFEFHANVTFKIGIHVQKYSKIFTLDTFKIIILKSMQEQNEGIIVLFLLNTIHKNR